MRTLTMTSLDTFTGLTHTLTVSGIIDQTLHAQVEVFRGFLAAQGFSPLLINTFIPNPGEIELDDRHTLDAGDLATL